MTQLSFQPTSFYFNLSLISELRGGGIANRPADIVDLFHANLVLQVYGLVYNSGAFFLVYAIP